jgi:hypothetical protein
MNGILKKDACATLGEKMIYVELLEKLRLLKKKKAKRQSESRES